MSKYKLVPIEPAREMWAAAGDAVVALSSQHHDAISEAVYKAMLAAAPAVQGEPVGWVWHSYNQTNFTSGSHHKEVLEAYGVKLTPVYTSPLPSPEVAKLLEAAEMALKEIECALNEAYNNAGSVCCQRPRFGKCCGEPYPAWSDTDKATMDRFAPHHRALEDAIRAYRKQGGDL